LLGIEGVKPETFTTATQFARMATRRPVTFGHLAAALPAKRPVLELAAEKNFLAMTDPVSLGRLVMLSGPAWTGYLELEGTGYALFKAYADGKAEQVARAISAR